MKILKEFVFLALFILVVVVIIGILFFEFIPTQVIDEPEKYEQAESTAKLLSQIQEEQQTSSDGERPEEVLQSYEVTQSQLYDSEQKVDYISGKVHPFYDYNAEIKDSVSGVVSDILDSVDTNTSSSSGNTNTTQSSNTNTTKPSNKTNTNRIDTDNLVDKTNTSTTTK